MYKYTEGWLPAGRWRREAFGKPAGRWRRAAFGEPAGGGGVRRSVLQAVRVRPSLPRRASIRGGFVLGRRLPASRVCRLCAFAPRFLVVRRSSGVSCSGGDHAGFASFASMRPPRVPPSFAPLSSLLVAPCSPAPLLPPACRPVRVPPSFAPLSSSLVAPCSPAPSRLRRLTPPCRHPSRLRRLTPPCRHPSRLRRLTPPGRQPPLCIFIHRVYIYAVIQCFTWNIVGCVSRGTSYEVYIYTSLCIFMQLYSVLR